MYACKSIVQKISNILVFYIYWTLGVEALLIELSIYLNAFKTQLTL